MTQTPCCDLCSKESLSGNPADWCSNSNCPCHKELATSQTPEDWREARRKYVEMWEKGEFEWNHHEGDNLGKKPISLERVWQTFIEPLLTETTKNVEREKLIEMGQILLKLRNTNLQSISNVLDQYHNRISKALNPNSSD